MKKGLLIIIVVIALIAMLLVSNYNGLVSKQEEVKNQFSNLDVMLQRRADLIPNLVETIKGYTTHESETLEKVIAARNRVVGAKSTEEEIKANGELSACLGRLLAVSEAYPELKANTSFMDLQSNLKETEDKISYARQFYNDAVLKYKNKLEVFPSNIVAGMFGFKPEPFFEAIGEERENPKVKF